LRCEIRKKEASCWVYKLLLVYIAVTEQDLVKRVDHPNLGIISDTFTCFLWKRRWLRDEHA